MINEDIILKLASDLVKLDEHFIYLDWDSEKISKPFEEKKRVYLEIDITALQALHKLYIESAILDYETSCKPYPLVFESLEYTSVVAQNFLNSNKREKKVKTSYRSYISNDYAENNFQHYCEACHEEPCMCSDRENSSTVHDF